MFGALVPEQCFFSFQSSAQQTVAGRLMDGILKHTGDGELNKIIHQTEKSGCCGSADGPPGIISPLLRWDNTSPMCP